MKMTSPSCPQTSASDITHFCTTANELEEKLTQDLYSLLRTEAVRNVIGGDLALAAVCSSATRSPLLRHALDNGRQSDCVSYIHNEMVLNDDLKIGSLVMFVKGFASNCAGTVSLALDTEAEAYSGPARVSSVSRSQIIVELMAGNRSSRHEAILNKAILLPGFSFDAVYGGPVASHMLSEKRRFQILSEDLRSGAHRKLIKSLAEIKFVWPDLFSKISHAVQIFVLSETVKPADRVIRHGSSAPDLPGVVFMNDYHCPEIVPDDMAENIVHEAVHNMIFSIESCSSWYDACREDELRSEIQSVWSSRNLTFYSFFHSLIVFATVKSYIERSLALFPSDLEKKKWLETRLTTLRIGFSILFERHHDQFMNGMFPLSEVGVSMYQSVVRPHFSRVSG